MSLIPSPPRAFSLHRSSHLIQVYFFLSDPQPHKNFLCSFFGTLNIDKKNRGTEEKTKLIKQTLPAKDIILPFQVVSLFLIPTITFSQNFVFLGFMSTIMPKYLKGIDICSQFKIDERFVSTSVPMPITPMLLL